MRQWVHCGIYSVCSDLTFLQLMPTTDEWWNTLFRKEGIVYQHVNLNEVSPLQEFPDESFNLVLLGEVFEHILNQPAGLLKGIHRILRPDGLLLLTTPNPSTLANALRLLQDRYILWGTPVFLKETKIEGGKIIDRGDIHYREYPAWVVRNLLSEVGFRVHVTRYVRSANSLMHGFVKRAFKRLLWLLGLSGRRLFAPGYIICARKHP